MAKMEAEAVLGVERRASVVETGVRWSTTPKTRAAAARATTANPEEMGAVVVQVVMVVKHPEREPEPASVGVVARTTAVSGRTAGRAVLWTRA